MTELTKTQKQDMVQKAARAAWHKGGWWGLLAMATGTGKTKCAVDEVVELFKEPNYGKDAKVLLVVPTEKLRDDNWKDEFLKWGAANEYLKIRRSCYASITKFERQYFDLVILDEAHWTTEANSEFFTKNTVRKVMALSATPPDPKGNETDKNKVNLFKQLRLKTDFFYPLEQARKDGLATALRITVIEGTLDNTVKCIEAGTKAARFMQTEQQRYEFLSKTIKNLMIAGKRDVVKFKSLERMRLIQNSLTKITIAEKLIAACKPEERMIVFGGSIAQIDKLLPGRVFHSKAGKPGSVAFQDFKDGKLNMLGVVDAANEGHNIPDLDKALVAQLSSNARELIQRAGRLRYRPNHTADLYIIVLTGTVDEDWFKKAIADFDPGIITYVHAKNL